MRTVLVVFLLLPTLALADSTIEKPPPANGQSSYELASHVMSSAGSPASGSGKKTNGTLGQPTPVGVGSSGNFAVNAGFWRAFWRIVSVFEPIISEVFRNALFQNFPNPFNPTTTIQYAVAKESPVELLVFNVQGQKVRTLVRDSKSVGKYSVVWDGRDDHGRLVASGVYFYRLRVGGYLSVKKMLLLK